MSILDKSTVIEPFGGICPNCDGKLEARWQETSFTFGAEEESATIYVALPIHTCAKCGFQTLDENAERLRHEAVCQHLHVLSPREIKAIRDRRGLSRPEFSKLTGIGEASLGRWERGAGVQSLAYDRYLRLIDTTDGISKLGSIVDVREEAKDFERDTRSSASAKVVRFPGLGESITAERLQSEFRLTLELKVA